MATSSQLFLLADHIKLSLLERQRALALNLNTPSSQFSHISQSLESLRVGLEGLERGDHSGGREGGREANDPLSRLRSQYNDLYQQLYGDGVSKTESSTRSKATLTQANDPALAADFERAQQTISETAQRSRRMQQNGSKLSRATGGAAGKTVRFHDNNENNNNNISTQRYRDSDDPDFDSDSDPNRAALFPPTRYTDDPNGNNNNHHQPNPLTPSNLDLPTESESTAHLTNAQLLHDHHSSILREQDSQLDSLASSINRQRHLSMAIGDELEDQIGLLDEVDRDVERNQRSLDGARRRLKKVADNASRAAEYCCGCSTSGLVIVGLIVVLVFLIVILK